MISSFSWWPADQQQLAEKLEELFAEQRRILTELEGLGVGPEHFTATS
jgi:hypothetical protein